MKNICVCIEGQLRGSKRCGSNIREHLIDSLYADLIIYAQNTPEINSHEAAARYGPNVGCVFYDNPKSSFEQIFDDLRRELGITFDWRETFKRVKDLNYTLGFSEPGTCIRRMYNRYLLSKYIHENILTIRDYDYFILTRSDIWFLEDFPFHMITDPHTLYSAITQRAGGINNNFMVFGKSLLSPVLNYITLFLDGSIAKLGGALNEEMFFLRAMRLRKVSRTFIENSWFISADSLKENTTWGKIKRQGEHFLKKPHEFRAAQKTASVTGILSVQFSGGLGNRLFQYHTATYLAKRWRKKFVFDTSKISRNPHENVKIEDLFSHEKIDSYVYTHVIEQGEKCDWAQRLSSIKPNGDVLLRGHLQTFWPQHITIPKLPIVVPFFNSENAILIHVRRGDYVSGCKHHFINLGNYYASCMREYESTFTNNEFVVFSDDISWCKENWSMDVRTTFIEENTLNTLSLMRFCRRGAILSNSTFGLWGAYLCMLASIQNKNYTVFCPSRFMSNQQLHDQQVGDLIYPEWVRRVDAGQAREAACRRPRASPKEV